MEELILNTPHFWSLGKSGDINKPEWYAAAIPSTKVTIKGYGDTPLKALQDLHVEMDKRKVVVTVQAANEYRIV